MPLAFPCTLAISDDDWTKLPAFLGQDGSLVNELQFRMILSIILNWRKREASSLKLQAVDNLKKDVDYIG